MPQRGSAEPHRGNAVLQRGFCIFLGRSSDFLPESEERVRRQGGSIFQTAVDQIARGKVVLSCEDAVLRRLMQ